MHRVLYALFILLITVSCLSQEIPLKERIDSIMNANYPKDQPGASIIITSDNQPFFKASYGLSDLADSSRITDQTIFRIGSITKQFTSIAILKLVESEKLSLDDKVSQFYPDWFANGPEITIRQLLTHTSGIPDLPGIQGIRDLMFADTPPDTLVHLISRAALIFDPGAKFEYSNSGYVILGAIVEQVSGMNYEQYLKRHFFQPLGMKNTFMTKSADHSAPVAKGYFKRPDQFIDAPLIHPSLLFAAGGLYSNLDDMARWNLSLNTDKILDRKLIELAFTPASLNDGTRTDYGLGFRKCEVNGTPSIEHGGGVFGFKCYGVRIEEEGLYVLILSNFERGNDYDRLVPLIAAQVMGRPYGSNNSTKAVDPTIVKLLTGQYLVAPGDTLQISFKNADLEMLRNGRTQLLRQADQHMFYGFDYQLFYDPKENDRITIKHRRSMKETAVRF